MPMVRGVITVAGGASFRGHYVDLSFQELIAVGEGGDGSWIPVTRRADLDDGGRFAFDLAESRSVRGPWLLEVLAPDGTLLHRQGYDQSLPEEIRLSVQPRTAPVLQPSDDPLLARRVKVTGRVLDSTGKRQAAKLQVTLWGQRLEDPSGEPQVVAIARTDGNGYFSFEYPRGRFRAAFGIVGIGSGVRIPIPLVADAFPRSTILVVSIPEREPPDDEECDCEPTAPRAPDPIDVVSSPESFSADTGGGRCVDFTVPNRAIEEFSSYLVVRTTEPAIQGLTLNAGKAALGRETVTTVATWIESRARTDGQPSPISRPADLRVSADALARLGERANGFTLLDLATAADVTTTDEIHRVLDVIKKPVPGRAVLNAQNPIDWDSEPTFYQAATIAHGHLLHFKQVWRADGYSLGDLLYSLPLAPCQKKQIAVLDWERREMAERTEAREVREELAALFERERDIAEIVQATLTETLRGASAAATFGLSSIINEGLGVLGLGVAGSGATQDSSRSLSANSLQQLRDRTLQAASSVRSQRSTVVQTVRQGETVRAQTEVVTNHNHCHAITVQYFEVLRHFLVTQELADVQECLFIPLFLSRFDTAKALRWRTPLTRFLKDRALRRAFDALQRVRDNWVDSDLPTGRLSEEVVEDLEGELRVSFVIPRPKDLDTGAYDDAAWGPYKPFLAADTFTLFNEILFPFLGRERDRMFQERVAPRIARGFLDKLTFHYIGASDEQEIKLDPTLVSTYVTGAQLLVTLRPADALPGWQRERIRALEMRATVDLPPGSRVTVHSGSARYRTAHFSHQLFRDRRIQNDLLVDDPVRISTWPDREEQRNPRAEDREIAGRLLGHLNEHLEHYHKVIWWTMDPDRRFMLLDGFEAPNAGGRSVASVVENRLIGIVGNCLVMPVAPGIHVDPTFRKDADRRVDLIDHYAPTSLAPPMRISIPTRGVFAEAVMGSCNSCEEKDESRFWRFEESPCGDEPTAIAPLSTETRRSEPGDLKPQEFPAPMINLQNAPPAPDPAGLGAALQVIGASNLFRDVTGLAQNQQNALASLAITQDTLRHMIGASADLAREKNAQQNLPSAMQTLYQAMKKGIVDQEQGKRLAEGFFKGAGGGGTEDRKVTDEAEVKDLLRRDDMTKVTYHRPPEFLQAEYRAEPEVAVEDAPKDPYGGYDLRRLDPDHPDSDANRVWGGAQRLPERGDRVPAAGEQGYVLQLQQDLFTVGLTFVPTDGVFGRLTEWAVREFQISARMPNVARENLDGEILPARYMDRLSRVPNSVPYIGPISGVANAATRTLLKAWVDRRWRCPVVIEAWEVEDDQRIGAGPVPSGGNLWLFDDPDHHPRRAWRMFARDFSGYYTFPAPRNGDDLNVIGDYAEYLAWSGPRSVPPDHTWWEAEVLPGPLVGVAGAEMTPAQLSTYKVVRAIAEQECEGHFDAINSYDDVFASLGLYHWAVGFWNEPSGDELGGFFSYLREADPDAFEKAIGAFGLRSATDWNGDGRDLFVPKRRHVSRLALQRDDWSFAPIRRDRDELDYLRSWHWFYRFVMAGRTVEGFYRRQWHMARVRIRDVLATRWGHDAPPVRLPDGANRPVTIGDYYTSERAVAIVVRWHIRAPGHMVFDSVAADRLERAFNAAGVPADLGDWDRRDGEAEADHRTRLDGYQEDLIDALVTEGNDIDSLPNVRDWPNWMGGANPYRFVLDPAALDPANPRLSTGHGSFRFDDSDLPPPAP